MESNRTYDFTDFTPSQINEMEEERLSKLDDAGIDELQVLASAKENLNVWNNYFNENITRGKDDANFLLRDQWTAIERGEFTRLFKPAMTFNKIYPEVTKILGEQRKNKPDLMVRSLTGKSSQEQINLLSDLLRTYCYKSENDLIYQTTFRSAIELGYGAYMVDLDYENPMSFDLSPRYRLITDPTRTAFDAQAVLPHKGDGNFCSLNYSMSLNEFHVTYPNIIHPTSYYDSRTLLDFNWETKDIVVICDYSEKEWYPITVYRLSNGMSVTKEQWEAMQKDFKIMKEVADSSLEVNGIIMREIPKILDDRKSQNYKIMRYRLIKDRIIGFMEWPSKHLPIVFNDGNSHYYDGKQYTKSYIHEARDSQKAINYIGSEIISEIKNRRREQWLGTADNIVGYEQIWRNPELQNGILLYKPDQKTGQIPTKMPPWDLSPALMENFQRGSQDIREILGMAESNQNGSRDISGRAKQQRQIDVSMNSYIYHDNHAQAVAQGGRIVLDLLTNTMSDDERYVILKKKDGKTESIVLNKKERNGTIANKIEKGDYDIEIDTGPSFSVQKEVALEFLQQTIQASPETFPLIADLWAKNLDVQFMPQISDRLQTLVPPQILAKEQGKQMPPPQPSPQEQQMQFEQQIKMQELAQKAQKLKIEEEASALEREKLVMEAHKIANDMKMDEYDHQMDLTQTQLEYKARMAKIMADLHKNSANSKR